MDNGKGQIAAARKRSEILYVEGYCDSSEDCPVRTVRIHIKDYDQDQRLVAPKVNLVCPLCGNPLKIHHARTAEEESVEQNTEARALVAVQMYNRDQGEVGPVPAGVVCDYRLPPTPPGWWGDDSKE